MRLLQKTSDQAHGRVAERWRDASGGEEDMGRGELATRKALRSRTEIKSLERKVSCRGSWTKAHGEGLERGLIRVYK